MKKKIDQAALTHLYRILQILPNIFGHGYFIAYIALNLIMQFSTSFQKEDSVMYNLTLSI